MATLEHVQLDCLWANAPYVYSGVLHVCKYLRNMLCEKPWE